MSEIVFKKGTNEDVEDFLKYFSKSINELFPYFSHNSRLYTIEADYSPNYLREKLKNGEKILYLAKAQENIVGYLLVMNNIAGVGFADWLAVDKSFQKKGIATRLLSMWEKEALDRGAHSLFLWTQTDEDVKFYLNRGFQKGGIFPKSWHGFDSVLIHKTLREPKEENFLKSYLSSKKS